MSIEQMEEKLCQLIEQAERTFRVPLEELRDGTRSDPLTNKAIQWIAREAVEASIPRDFIADMLHRDLAFVLHCEKRGSAGVGAEENLINAAELLWSIDGSEIISAKRTQFVVDARTYIIAGLRSIGRIWTQIARAIQRDHTTAIEALKRLANPGTVERIAKQIGCKPTRAEIEMHASMVAIGNPLPTPPDAARENTRAIQVKRRELEKAPQCDLRTIERVVAVSIRRALRLLPDGCEIVIRKPALEAPQ